MLRISLILNLFDHFKNKQYAQGKVYYISATDSCHNSGLSLLEEKEQVKKLLVGLRQALKKEEEEYRKAYSDVPQYLLDQN